MSTLLNTPKIIYKREAQGCRVESWISRENHFLLSIGVSTCSLLARLDSTLEKDDKLSVFVGVHSLIEASRG